MKKYIPEHKVQRMRNLATKKFGAKTKIQVGYKKNNEEHKEGDVWTEGKKTWTIKNGITQTVTKLDKARNTVIMPMFCPKCNDKYMRGQLDKLFWKLYGECSKCRIAYETDLKIKGTYGEYEKNILAGNIKDWKNDLESAAKSFVSETNRKGYVTETGKIEDWSKENKTEIEKTVNETISGISKKLTSQLEKLNNNN